MTTNGMRNRLGMAGGLLMIVALAGCSKPAPEEPPLESNAATEEVAPAPSATPAPLPSEAPATKATTAAIAPPPAAEIAPDEQMQDDADATGMTSRVSRGDDAPAIDDQTVNETAPQ